MSEQKFFDARVERIDTQAQQTTFVLADAQIKTFPKTTPSLEEGMRGVLTIEDEGCFVFYPYPNQRLRRWPAQDCTSEDTGGPEYWGWVVEGTDKGILCKPGCIPGKDDYSVEKLRRVEIHLHIDSLTARHHVMREGESPLRFHSGFNQADADNGWKQVREVGVETEQDIEREKAEVIGSARQYWEDLLRECAEVRVVQGGVHHVAHPVETGIGYNGRTFRIHWLDSRLAPSICTLSTQGRIPAWMRDKMPDNAVISEAAA